MPSNEPVIAVRVPQELYDAIKSHADAENRSMGNYVRVMLVKAFKRSEIEESAHRALFGPRKSTYKTSPF